MGHFAVRCSFKPTLSLEKGRSATLSFIAAVTLPVPSSALRHFGDGDPLWRPSNVTAPRLDIEVGKTNGSFRSATTVDSSGLDF